MSQRDPVTKSDFLAWREMGITRDFFLDIKEMIEDLAADLIVNAGTDQLSDRYKSGKLAGLTNLADWKPQFRRDDEDVKI